MISDLLKKSLLVFTILCSSVYAEDQGGEDIYAESLKDVTTIAAIGVGGAILGLSTLSFVDEPKDHLRNIVVGGAIGVIIGVGVVAWTQANKSKNIYNENAYQFDPKKFDTSKRLSWHNLSQQQNFQSHNIQAPEYLRYSFSF